LLKRPTTSLSVCLRAKKKKEVDNKEFIPTTFQGRGEEFGGLRSAVYSTPEEGIFIGGAKGWSTRKKRPQ